MSGNEKDKAKINWIVFLLVMLIAVSVGAVVLLREPVDVPDGSGELMTASTGWGTTHFSNLSAADIEATDDLTVGDDLTVSDDTVIAGYMRIGASTTFSVTDGGTITPTGTYMPLESAGAVGCSDIVTGTAGDRLVLINTCAHSITITDTGSLKLGSNRILAQYDSLELWSDGTYWIEVGYAENAGSGTTTFANLSTTDLAVTDDLSVTDDTSIGGELTVTGVVTGADLVAVGDGTIGDDLAVTDDLTVSGIVSIGEFGRLVEQTAITVTNGATFTPTGTYQPITSAGTVTPTISTSGYTAGDLLVITNETATTVNFADSGTLMLNTARAMGQYDVLALLFDGTNWLEKFFNNN